MDALFPFQSPTVAERSRHRIILDNESTLQFVDIDDDDDVMAFGRSSEKLKQFLEPIIGTGNFCSNDEVTRALNTGYLKRLMDSGADDYDYNYGLLRSLVKGTVEHLKDKFEAASLTHGEKVLLWMLTNKDKDTDDNTHQRSHLIELLVFFAETAAQQDSPDKRRQCTMDFTRFLLNNVLMSSIAKKNKAGLKYKNLLNDLNEHKVKNDDGEDEDEPLLPEDSKLDVTVVRSQDPDLYITHVKLAIVAYIVGDDSMESVVTLFDSKLTAFTGGLKYHEQRKKPKVLPKRAQTDRVRACFATQDFDYQEANVNDEVAFFVKGQRPTIKAKVPPSVKVDASVGAVTTQGTATAFLDSAAGAEVFSNLCRIKGGCAGKKKDDLSFKEVSNMCDFFLDPLLNAALGIDASALAPVGQSAIVSVSPSSERDSSPLTVGSAVEHQEGIKVTEEDLRRFFQRLFAQRNDDDCKHLKNLEKDDLFPEPWCADKLWRSDELESDIDPVLTGQKWTIEDFDIMGIIGGGNYGRVLILRSKEFTDLRACGKVEFFTTHDFFKSFLLELVESTKVQHPNIARTLGYFAIPWLGDRYMPIGMCILQEQGRYNLRKKVKELNDPSKGLDPAEKLVEVIAIMVQILSAVEALQAMGILHRDIKPENIVYFKDGVWKLVDFGLARDYDADGNLTEETGTREYIPPEGKGPKHDNYASGITMLELIFGKYPLEKVPSQVELTEAFKIQGIPEEAAQQAFDLCEGLTLESEEKRWTAKHALVAASKLLDSLSK